ncbi:MAG: FAD-dependent oxidoreductase [Beijerinckiaceae bacterium]|jgi:succinate dehydrogenase/fumarate reductase flavoprotein subunit|nr:FAD-dependent oxidoreductase [Beijerinckiaceae bacterium]
MTTEETFDVVVVGSGAAGLSAALTASIHGLSVVVIEKAATLGGSTAISGGAVWVPDNPHISTIGRTESRADVLAYLGAMLGNRLKPDMVGAFLDRGPEMVAFLEKHTELRLIPRAVSPDYHPGLPGAAQGGRTLDPAPFDGRRLGAAFKRLRMPLKEFLVFGGMMVNRKDIDTLLGATKTIPNFWGTAKLLLRYGLDRLKHPRGTRLLMGNALAARLVKSALDRGIELRENHAACSLIRSDERVTGVVVEGPAGETRLHARRGVVFATGGFPGSDSMRAAHLPHAATHFSMAPAENTGDGIRLGVEAGGRLSEENIGNAFWTPVSLLKNPDGTTTRFPHLILDRAKPGLIAVDQSGQRFVNEANSYHDFVEAMHRRHESTPAIPAFLVADSAFVRKYGLGLVRPGSGSHQRFIDAGYLLTGNSINELANRMGVPAEALSAAVAGMNASAESGEDPAFGKGSTAYNRYLGDAAHKPNPCLGPIRTAPFHAVKVYPGDIGTAAGLETDPQARVLGPNGPIPGLYAVGNDMNSIMAGSYPSAGITLGPALTFGYIAGISLAGTQTTE